MIRKITAADHDAYISMVKAFYTSEAVDHTVDPRNFEAAFTELMDSDKYAEAYIIESSGNTAGYALLANTFSQEAGGPVIWIEELYILPEYRGKGLGHEFFDYLQKEHCSGTARLRLEATASNARAMALYEKLGFKNLDYIQMIKEL